MNFRDLDGHQAIAQALPAPVVAGAEFVAPLAPEVVIPLLIGGAIAAAIVTAPDQAPSSTTAEGVSAQAVPAPSPTTVTPTEPEARPGPEVPPVELPAPPTERIEVFRGTDRQFENLVWEETGWLLSEAALKYYVENPGAGVADALRYASQVHQEWINIFDTEAAYVEKHGELGSELSRDYGLPRTFASLTRYRAVAERFAGPGGHVYSGFVPPKDLIPQTLATATEGEYLVKFGIYGLTRLR